MLLPAVYLLMGRGSLVRAGEQSKGPDDIDIGLPTVSDTDTDTEHW